MEQHVPVEHADVASDPKVALVVELGGVLILAVAACKDYRKMEGEASERSLWAKFLIGT